MKPRAHAYPAARRIALVADTHGALAAPLRAELGGADLVVHAGDVGARAVLDSLATVAPTLAVRGNNDVPAKWPARERHVPRTLPEVLEIELAGGVLAVVHGHQWPRVNTRHERLRAAFPAARCVVYGHSHRRVLDTGGAPWIVNPGAAGVARTFGGASWVGLVIRSGRWRFFLGAFDAQTGTELPHDNPLESRT